MEYAWYYDLVLLYVVYSFLGWVGETVVAAARGRGFVKRGFAAGPFCYVYGLAAVIMAVGFDDLRDNLGYLFLGCTVVAAPGGTTRVTASTSTATSACPTRFCGACWAASRCCGATAC